MSAMESDADQAPADDTARSVTSATEQAAEAVSSDSKGVCELESTPESGADTTGETGTAGETMMITFKLYATLQDLLPRGSVKNAVEIEVATDTTLYDIIDRYQVPRELAHLVLVNGIFFCDADRTAKGLLKPHDVLAIWPPVAGG